MWLWVVGVVAVVGTVTVVAVGSGASLSEVYEDRPDRTIPVGRPLRSDDLRDVTFTTAVRGYRMDEVDALLARIRADLMAREAHGPSGDDASVDAGTGVDPPGGASAAPRRVRRVPPSGPGDPGTVSPPQPSSPS